MTSEESIEDHKKILSFALTRVFPMIDEFEFANQIEVSVDSGVIVLLTQRLIYQGASPDQITDIVRKASETMYEKLLAEQAGEEAAKSSAEKPYEVSPETNVITLKKPSK